MTPEPVTEAYQYCPERMEGIPRSEPDLKSQRFQAEAPPMQKHSHGAWPQHGILRDRDVFPGA